MEQMYNDPTRTRRPRMESPAKRSLIGMTPEEIVAHTREMQHADHDDEAARKELILSYIFAAIALGLPALKFLHDVFQN